MTRRKALETFGCGFGMLGLAGVLERQACAEPSLRAQTPQFPAKAKHVIFLFMNGGPSHVDTFDPKPALAKYANKPLPMENLRTERKTGGALPSPFKFQKHGQSGIEVSEIFPHLATCVDDMAIIRSMYADVPNHEPSLMLMNCGEARLVRPS